VYNANTFVSPDSYQQVINLPSSEESVLIGL